jgi:hypothetical protein
MTEYLTMDLLWVLYCAFLEDKFPNASKPDKGRFGNAVRHLIEIEKKGDVPARFVQHTQDDRGTGLRPGQLP